LSELEAGIRLNLGAGRTPLPGYENWDLKTGQPAYPLPLPNNSVDEVRASHVLEHFSHLEVMDVLGEWARVLKPGGVLKVAVPNFDWIIANNKDPILHLYVMGGQTDEYDFHHSIFDEETLRGALAAVGLVEIEPWVSEVRDCASLPVSLNLQGRKDPALSEPVEEIPPPVELELDCDQIKAVLSAPRLGFLDMSFTATKALQPLGISIERLGGVFWHQSMTNLFEAHAQAGVKYLLTMDYDSLFTTEDVVELFRLLETRPEIDAACALQMRREKGTVLFHTQRARDSSEAGEVAAIPLSELRAEAMPIYTGHFGLTLLRAEKLARVERPWFLGVPDTEGSWGEGRTDADIEFWRRWNAAGNTLYLANRCVIGHLELMITWPDYRLRALHQHVGEYNQQGHRKPMGVWR
jgi:hypothetical protein